MQNLPSPDGRGWKMEGDNLVPLLMTKENVRRNIVDLPACRCKKWACTRKCSRKLSKILCKHIAFLGLVHF